MLFTLLNSDCCSNNKLNGKYSLWLYVETMIVIVIEEINSSVAQHPRFLLKHLSCVSACVWFLISYRNDIGSNITERKKSKIQFCYHGYWVWNGILCFKTGLLFFKRINWTEIRRWQVNFFFHSRRNLLTSLNSSFCIHANFFNRWFPVILLLLLLTSFQLIIFRRNFSIFSII